MTKPTGPVLLVTHPTRPEAAAMATKATALLESRGCRVVVLADDGGPLPADLALAVSLGGDGTMLRTVDLVAEMGVPVLGVNVGHLGYLTAVEPDHLLVALTRFAEGDYDIEERMTMCVTVSGRDDRWLAVNEAVLERIESGQTVRLGLTFNGEFFTSYVADGLIVSTPTGSTAYNLSARGPVASPRLHALFITPVCPHSLFDRTLALDADEAVDIEVLEERAAALVVDGRLVVTVEPGEVVSVRKGPHPARLVRLERRDFHQIVKAKFGLADR